MQNEGVKPQVGLGKIILNSCTGTLIEWYDFYIFGSLATIIAVQFFPKGNSTANLLATLATFATGFIVRPFGAAFFGRMGDLVGRKHTFLLTLLMMGFATTAIGLIPDYKAIGVGAPILLVLLRLIQGLALGGQYGGAATYVAENSPPHRRGFYTSFIQTTATLGFFVSLLVILGTKTGVGPKAFGDWGWRVPFLLSSVLVIFSYLIRRKMVESPMFAEIKAKGETSKNPLAESFLNPVNRNKVFLALFGLTAGQGVVWYTSQFYALFFLQKVLNVQDSMAYEIVAIALLIGTPFFVLFGALSDRIGRKNIIMLGLALAIVGYIPIYKTMQRIGTFNDQSYGPPQVPIIKTTDAKTGVVTAVRFIIMTDDDGITQTTSFPVRPTGPALATSPDPASVEIKLPPVKLWEMVGLVFLQVLFVTMVYGPIAAALVEMFPTKIRYTSMSVPYHIGNGVFGGLVPLIAVAMVNRTGEKMSGLYYPMGIALITLVIGTAYIHEKKTPEGFVEETAPEPDATALDDGRV